MQVGAAAARWLLWTAGPNPSTRAGRRLSRAADHQGKRGPVPRASPPSPEPLLRLPGESQRGPGSGSAKEPPPPTMGGWSSTPELVSREQLSFGAKPRPDPSPPGRARPLHRRRGQSRPPPGPAPLQHPRGRRGRGGAEGAGRRGRGGASGSSTPRPPAHTAPQHSRRALCPHISQRSFLCSPGEACVQGGNRAGNPRVYKEEEKNKEKKTV